MDAHPSSPSHFSTSNALTTNSFIRLHIYPIYMPVKVDATQRFPFFQFINLVSRHMGILGWGIGPSQDLWRITHIHTHIHTAHTSMPRTGFEYTTHRSSDRRPCDHSDRYTLPWPRRLPPETCVFSLNPIQLQKLFCLVLNKTTLLIIVPSFLRF
jgi:hypothetical protein